MTARRRFASPIVLCLFPVLALAALHGCSGDDSSGGGGGGSGGAAGSEGGVCPTESDVFEAGDDTGSTDPYGAKAAGQARAGRLTSAAMIVQPAHGRQRVNVGDFVLANDKIAVTIEDKGLSDGYARFGGEILAVDRVGDDGKPMGTSYYVETLMALSIQMVNPTSVSVMNDGSDGKAAVVRVSGPLEAIPFLDGSLATLFPRRYDVQAAYDYVLEPGSNKLLVRLGIMNPAPDPIEFAFDGISDEIHGFFQTNHNKFVTEANGFGKATGDLPWAGFVNEGTSFAWRAAGDETLQLGLEVSGFVYTLGPGFNADACAVTWVDHAEVVAGGPEYDGLRVALNEADGAEAWREISGTVKDADGNPVADAYVHERDDTGKYLSRTKADGSGNYVIHAPAGQAVKLIPQAKGYPLGSGTDVGGSATSSDLAFDPTGKLHVTALDSVSNEPIPVRVQVIPKAGYTSAPDEFGVQDEANGSAARGLRHHRRRDPERAARRPRGDRHPRLRVRAVGPDRDRHRGADQRRARHARAQRGQHRLDVRRLAHPQLPERGFRRHAGEQGGQRHLRRPGDPRLQRARVGDRLSAHRGKARPRRSGPSACPARSSPPSPGATSAWCRCSPSRTRSTTAPSSGSAKSRRRCSPTFRRSRKIRC